jgi:branched-chain amino acid transport system permease protein
MRFNYNYLYIVLTIACLLVWGGEARGYFPPYYLQVFMLILINIILTTSLNVINGFCGQLSIGHAGFMAIGAYSSVLLTTVLFEIKGGPSHLPIFLLALVIGGVVAGGVGYGVGLPILRLKGDYLAIVTLAFGQVIHSLIRLTDEIGEFFQKIGLSWLGEIFLSLGGPRGLTGIPRLTHPLIITGITILTIFVVNRLVHSSYGRAWVSIREDETSAEMMGVDVTKYKVLAFTIAGFFAGVGGALYAHILMFIHPDHFSLIKSVEYLVFLYLGGMGSIIGGIVAASSLTFLLEFLRITPLREYRLIVYPLILIVLMLTKSEGLFKRDL